MRSGSLWLVVGATGCVATPPDQGPLPVRNQHPAQLTVQHLDPVSAVTVPPGELRLRTGMAYTSMFLSESNFGDSYVMDGELLRTAVTATVGLSECLDLQVELPTLYASGGFLDGFLIDYHKALDLPDQGRSNVPQNRFRVDAFYQGQEVYRLQDNELMLADLPIALGWSVIRPEMGRPGLLLRAGVELPTGDAARGSGNGKLDAALGLASSLPCSYGTWHGFAQHSFAGTPSAVRATGFRYQDVSSLGLGIELGLTDHLSALVQTEWETSVLRDLDLDDATGPQWLLWLGGRLRLDHDMDLEFAIGEDLLGYVSSDVSFWLSFAWQPGSGRDKAGQRPGNGP